MWGILLCRWSLLGALQKLSPRRNPSRQGVGRVDLRRRQDAAPLPQEEADRLLPARLPRHRRKRLRQQEVGLR